jgi:CRP-like cAMP-binding protein
MLSLVERTTFLRGVLPFVGIPSNQLRTLAAVTKEIEIGRDDMLFVAGSGGDTFYVVIAGQIALEEAHGAAGSVARIGTVGPGEALGEDTVFDGGTHVMNATAITNCRLLAVERSVLLALLDEQPSLARALIVWLSVRLRETNFKLAACIRSRPRSVISLLDQIGAEG